MKEIKPFRATHFEGMNGRQYCNVKARDPITTRRHHLVTCGLCQTMMRHHGITPEVAADWYRKRPDRSQGLKMKYFVLKPAGDDVYAQASRVAMSTYATYIDEFNPQLADEMRKWVESEAKAVRK